MKKKLCLILSLVMILATFSPYALAKENKVEYTYKALKDNTVEITAYKGTDTDVVVPAKLGGKIVSRVGELAFSNNKNIVTLKISDGIKKISDDAFQGCTSIKTVVLPNSITEIGFGAFQGCVSLSEINLPTKLKTISQALFWYCESLKEITIPSSVSEIESEAFTNCISLEKVNFSKGLKSIGFRAFVECKSLKEVILPSTLKTVDADAFYNCTALEKVSVPDGLKYFNSDALFNTAFWLNEENWENGLLYIGNHLITSKDSVSGDVKVKKGTKSISPSVFFNCKELTSVYIPKSVVSFAKQYTSCFQGCSKLKTITVDKENKYYSSAAGILYNKDKTVIYRYPSAKSGKVFNIPKKVVRIENGAFAGSKNLTTINFDNDSKAVIGWSSLYDCKAIKTMTIPRNVTVDEECGLGWYYKGEDLDMDGRINGWVKGFVLKGYAGSDAENYASCAAVKFVSLCKNGKSHKTVKAKGKAPTYFEYGYTAHKRCTVCGERIGCYQVNKKYLDMTSISVASGKGFIKVSYKAVKDANGFQVMYVDKNRKQVRKIFMTDKSTTVKITGVPKGEYKVFARAMIKKGNQKAYSSWCFDGKMRVVTVK